MTARFPHEPPHDPQDEIAPRPEPGTIEAFASVPVAQHDDHSGAPSAAVDPARLELDTSPDPLEDFVLLPGLLRRWEIQQVVKADSEYRIEEAGEMADHTPLFAVYRRDPPAHANIEIGVPVGLSFEDGQTTVPARLLPISGDPLMAVLVLDGNPDEVGALARVRDHLGRPAHRPTEGASARGAKPRCQEGAP